MNFRLKWELIQPPVGVAARPDTEMDPGFRLWLTSMPLPTFPIQAGVRGVQTRNQLWSLCLPENNQCLLFFLRCGPIILFFEFPHVCVFPPFSHS